jgi:hypothetical protein
MTMVVLSITGDTLFLGLWDRFTIQMLGEGEQVHWLSVRPTNPPIEDQAHDGSRADFE